MKLLYTVMILSVMQMPVIKSKETTSLRDILKKFQVNELQILNQELSEKAKILSENVLKDEIVQLAATTEMQEFKCNMTDFLDYYPWYKRYGLFSELAELFKSNIPDVNNSSTDSLYIRQLLNEHGYGEINENYENKFKEFIEQKFLSKFEESKAQLSQEELKQEQVIIQGINEFKKCHDYECFYKMLIKLVYTPKEQLFHFNSLKLIKLNIFFANRASDIMLAVLKDQRLQELSLEVKQNLTTNIKKIIQKFENNQDIDEVNEIIQRFSQKIVLKFLSSKVISLKDQQLLTQIFDDHGYTKFDNLNGDKFKDFFEQDLEMKFKEMKADLNQEELLKIEPLYRWFEQTKNLTTHDERVEAFDKLYVLEEFI
ncbi:uncharacterized protein LOC119615638 [Lucilia sericata]|uniref:uncharacterized protein LOC119615638 n=1 Tax=Lucilia sericata TaxID=13632 RepID=UPI0018A87BF1|nr:uncharacterized protein LOC119615638 [Lucilia sericata]